ncbi:hypothetical protein MSG28_000785 [Choristoneura fumiferana]|uniref:Uncharacterized protein n=2 Tax=Choristoneura fumiferana TaxID=7141 RepID=A0ACC0K2G9_CHOFU|nr:hypothetical protein MSG28_000785 [Choristoneura fumiferana]
MGEKDLLAKLANVPLAKPGFDALNMTAPVLVQMNPDGKWENTKPDGLDEERLKAVVAHLVKSKALSAAQSYCCQCAAENKLEAGQSNYVPVIMMPIYPADECPFDMECEVQKMKEAEKKPTKKAAKTTEAEASDDKDKESKKKKKRGKPAHVLNNNLNHNTYNTLEWIHHVLIPTLRYMKETMSPLTLTIRLIVKPVWVTQKPQLKAMQSKK